jgi:hypothetical protein
MCNSDVNILILNDIPDLSLLDSFGILLNKNNGRMFASTKRIICLDDGSQNSAFIMTNSIHWERLELIGFVWQVKVSPRAS